MSYLRAVNHKTKTLNTYKYLTVFCGAHIETGVFVLIVIFRRTVVLLMAELAY